MVKRRDYSKAALKQEREQTNRDGTHLNSRCSSFLWSTLMPWLYLPSSNSRRNIVTAEKPLSCNEAKPIIFEIQIQYAGHEVQTFVSSVGISDTKRRGSRHHRNANAERKR
jgi:hypothetical protein